MLQKAEQILLEIGRLYDIERTLREGKAPPEERARMRGELAAPVLERIRAYLEADHSLPKSPFGKAKAYTLSRWTELVRYVDEGRFENDNNLTENQVRPLTLGRKNFLFMGNHDAARRAAVIYSLLAICKRHDVNPWTWLRDVLARIPTHPASRVSELLPHRWAGPAESQALPGCLARIRADMYLPGRIRTDGSPNGAIGAVLDQGYRKPGARARDTRRAMPLRMGAP